ncbi:substrate-binding domain-containing protein [Devosia psychrophila]|uniref:ABC transporter substrate-binding protein n=1 Tax=Devosia psychrophila TaxID=728005 RepID=A0A0F5Q128_9HYPH|nr:substrate-binding domain-containing protein [Devosia psychrophila]KKC33784.1 ABC transporter substrate-binding protein [Devosia psychrophila]SFC46191.1 ribose transport system substrate-binding protein [Devosia psychrophila]
MKLVKSLLATAIVAGSLGGVAVAQDKVTIGVSVPAADHGWTGGVNYFAQQSIDRLKTTYPNVEFVFASAPDAPKQIADIEDMVSTRNIDALVILPGDPDAMTSAIKQVKDAGKFVTVVDRQLSITGVENLYVAGDNPGLGANAATYFKEALPEGGNIVILRGLPIPIDQQRFDGFMSGIEGGNFTVLDDEFANWNRDDGFKVMQDFLTRFPDIKGVWTQDDDISLGAIEAIKQAGRESEMFVVGGAGMQQILQAVANGDALTPVDVSYSPAMIATAIELTTSHLVGGVQVAGRYILDSTLITKDNAADFLDADSPF